MPMYEMFLALGITMVVCNYRQKGAPDRIFSLAQLLFFTLIFDRYEYNINGQDYGASSTFSSLIASSYDIYAKDKHQCVIRNTTVVSQPFGTISLI